MDTALLQDSTEEASQPSIVEKFSIEGLFGYRSVSLASKYAATLLIARNGSGKTTLLAALDAFLRGQFSRFVGLQFEQISCQLRGYAGQLILLKSDIDRLSEFAVGGELGVKAKSWELQPVALLELVENGFAGAKYSDLMDNPTFHAIYTKMGYDYQGARTQCDRLAALIEARHPELSALRRALRNTLSGIEIVYLPTYRRIELSLPEAESRPGGRRKSVLSKLGVARSGLHTADIQFGLGDISDRLRVLYSEMLFLSNQGYGKVSANVINDLISGDYKNDESGPKELPTRESLEIFFSRIKDAEKEFRPTRYANMINIPDLDRVYNGDAPQDAKPFLSYFLHQLNLVIQQSRGAEGLVENFINSCNRYLSGNDESADTLAYRPVEFSDEKRLVFNRRNLRVKVMSLAAESEVPFESLSSGEKQMISLFARIYLYPQPKIILIDEPELSLSLDWQRQILPDVLKAPTCKQVVAITHSPFIFDNELEPFAGSLRVNISKRNKASSDLESDFNDNEDDDSNE